MSDDVARLLIEKISEITIEIRKLREVISGENL